MVKYSILVLMVSAISSGVSAQDNSYRDVEYDLRQGLELREVARRAHANAEGYWDEKPPSDYSGTDYPGTDQNLSAYEAVDEIYNRARAAQGNPKLDSQALDIIHVATSVIDAWPQCEDSYGAIKRAVEIMPRRAPELVAQVAANGNCKCSGAGLWPPQRIETRMRSDLRHALLDVPSACACSQTAMLAGVAGLPENDAYADAATDEERTNIANAMAERVQEIVNQTISEQSRNGWECACVDINIASTMQAIGAEGLQESVYTNLAEKYAKAGGASLVVDSFGVVGWYPDLAWGKESYISRDNVLRRNASVYRGDRLVLDPFTPRTEFYGLEDGSYEGFGQHQITSTQIPTDIIISEYAEGWNQKSLALPEGQRDPDERNRAIEIYNGSGKPIDLGQRQYFVEIYGKPGKPGPVLAATGTNDTGSAEETSLVKNRVTLDSITTFKLDSYELSADAKTALDGLAATLGSVELASEILVVGHTCSLASDEYNAVLSENRARSVRDYLVARGIDPARLRIEGRGESEPAFSNATEESRRRNRRVEVDFVTQQEVRHEVLADAPTPVSGWEADSVVVATDEVGYGSADTPRQVLTLTGVVEPGKTLVIAYSKSDDALIEQADIVTDKLNFGPNESLAMRRDGNPTMCEASGYAFVKDYDIDSVRNLQPSPPFVPVTGPITADPGKTGPRGGDKASPN